MIQGLVNTHGNEGYVKFLSLVEQAKGRAVRVAMEVRLYPYFKGLVEKAPESDTKLTMVSRIDPSEVGEISEDVKVEVIRLVK